MNQILMHLDSWIIDPTEDFKSYFRKSVTGHLTL